MAVIRRIATTAARRALLSRQYELWVKCGPAGMRAKAVRRKLGRGLQCPFAWTGKLGPHLTQYRQAQAYLRTKWYPDPFSHLTVIDIGRKMGDIFNRQTFREFTAPKR